MGAPRAAREAVGHWLGDRVGAFARDDVLLAISELVTNSVRHAGTAPDDVIRVRLGVWNGRLHLAVEDPGRNGDVARRPRAPGRRWARATSSTELTLRWRVSCRRGTRVRAEMARTAA